MSLIVSYLLPGHFKTKDESDVDQMYAVLCELIGRLWGLNEFSVEILPNALAAPMFQVSM